MIRTPMALTTEERLFLEKLPTLIASCERLLASTSPESLIIHASTAGVLRALRERQAELQAELREGVVEAQPKAQEKRHA